MLGGDIMYKLEDLTKYEYFKDVEIAYALDSLTGVVSRGYILGFAKHLVDNNVPFMMGIMDIDNFKLVNDNYGHKFGDECLKSLASNLATFVGENGLVGRFGGDEFIIIYFGETDYDNVYNYIASIYNCGKIVRRRLNFQNVHFYVTATTGCASFPKDADNYDQLFLTVDKALYRGKTKGRNCFIVYVESKHKNIDVHKKEASLLSVIFRNLNNMVNTGCTLNNPDEVIKNMLDYVTKSLQVSQAVFVKKDKTVISSAVGSMHEVDEDCLEILGGLVANDEVFAPVNMKEVKKKNKKLAKFVEDRNLLTFIISKVASLNRFYGYILLFEGKIERIWQDKDVELLMYMDRLIYILLSENCEKVE